jgi:cation diffusion facilitator family transporter
MSSDRLQRGLRATFAGIAVNFVLGVAKLLAGIFGHSHALIADATESFADIFNSLVVWRGLVVAAEPADEDHPYGHGKAESLAAAFGAGTLLLASLWIALKGINDLNAWLHPGNNFVREQPQWFTLIILGTVVVVKTVLSRFVAHEGHATNNAAVKTDAWHHIADIVTSTAAAIGIIIALIGGPKFVCADDFAAVFAALIIGISGWKLLLPALDELMDKIGDTQTIAEIKKIAADVAGVANVEKCLVRKTGWELLVDMHVEVAPQMTVLRSHEIAHDVKDAVQKKFPSVRDVLIHIEPLDIPAKKS